MPGIRISIRYKILFVFGALLIGAICFYTLLASSIFRQEKTALLYDINHSAAINASAQLKTSLLQTSEQLRLYALLRLVPTAQELRLDPDQLRKIHMDGVQAFQKDGTTLKTVELPNNPLKLEREISSLKTTLDEAEKEGFSFSHDPKEETQNHFLLATRVSVSINNKSETYIIVGRVDIRFFFEPLQSTNLYTGYLLKPSGEVFFHAIRSSLQPNNSIPSHPLLSSLTDPNKNQSSGVTTFKINDKQWYGAYAPVNLGHLFFISQADQGEITSAINTLIKRSIVFGVIVITATFLAIVVFSFTLTKNLNRLAEAASEIGRGNLSTSITVASKDEIADLAKTFNSMASSLKLSREVIEEHNRELENKVKERTLELKQKNEAIKEAQEALIKTSQLAVVGEVAGRAAHEVLNPLTAISTRAEKAEKDFLGGNTTSKAFEEILSAWNGDYKTGGLDGLITILKGPSKVREGQTLFEEDIENLNMLLTLWKESEIKVGNDFAFISDRAHRIQNILNELREYSRASTARREERCHEILSEAILTMSDYIEKHHVKIARNFGSDNDRVVLNKDEFIQIVSNLIRNSLQAVCARAVTAERVPGVIGIRTIRQGDFLVIDIVDNGVGIPKDRQSMLFEYGFSTKPPSEGTGLGLAICRRYARAFGGDVVLHCSEPNRMTCFRITVPLKIEAPPKAVAA